MNNRFANLTSNACSIACHCGNISLELKCTPTWARDCNCSICHRYAALWSYVPKPQFMVTWSKEEPKGYCWGDEQVVFYHCPICGCITHYVTTEKCDEQFVAVNMRMAELTMILQLSIEHVDNAE